MFPHWIQASRIFRSRLCVELRWSFGEGYNNTDEDCLYLNIYSPRNAVRLLFVRYLWKSWTVRFAIVYGIAMNFASTLQTSGCRWAGARNVPRHGVDPRRLEPLRLWRGVRQSNSADVWRHRGHHQLQTRHSWCVWNRRIQVWLVSFKKLLWRFRVLLFACVHSSLIHSSFVAVG